MIERALRNLIKWLLPLVAPRSRELLHGLLTETAAIDTGPERRSWLAHGLLWTLRSLATGRRIASAGVLLGGMTLLTWVDRHTGPDIGGQVAMAVLLMTAFLAGALSGSRRAWIPAVPAVLVGLTLAVVHTVAIVLPGASPTHGLRWALSLAVLVGPAVAASYTGAGVISVVRGKGGRSR
jgi:hypothetical protein